MHIWLSRPQPAHEFHSSWQNCVQLHMCPSNDSRHNYSWNKRNNIFNLIKTYISTTASITKVFSILYLTFCSVNLFLSSTFFDCIKKRRYIHATKHFPEFNLFKKLFFCRLGKDYISIYESSTCPDGFWAKKILLMKTKCV